MITEMSRAIRLSGGRIAAIYANTDLLIILTINADGLAATMLWNAMALSSNARALAFAPSRR